MTSGWPDDELIVCSRSDPAAFAGIFDRHHAQLYRYLRRRVGAGLAADLTAETFVTAFARRAAYRPETQDARPWLYGIAHIARVSSNMGQPLAVAEFGIAVDLLFEYPSPPALRSALYEIAARLPGVTLVADSRDLIGRRAAEVYMPPGFPGNGGEALFFDPSTSAVLGVADLVGSRLQCPPGWEAAVLASGYVSSKHQLPPGAPRSLRPVTQPTSAPGCPNPTSGQPTPTPVGQPAPSPSTSPGQQPSG